MTPYLIAHKVRGQPTFDIAARLACPECATEGCTECDGLGYWWIIPTSGHRAYPFGYWSLDELFWAPGVDDPKIPITDASDAIMVKDYSSWPDHYPSRSAPAGPGLAKTILAKLGLGRPTTIQRRL